MLLLLQIVFCILAVIGVTAILPVGAFLGWTWAIAVALIAVLFGILMLLCKQSYQAKHPELFENAQADEANTPTADANISADEKKE